MKKHPFQKGQGLVEYALLLVLIALITGGAMKLAGVSVKSVFCSTAKSLGGTPGTCSESLFQDDFTGNLGNWTITSGTWKITDGKLCGSGGEGKMFVNIPSTNYVVTLKGAKLDSGSGFGLYFRASNFSNVNGYNFQFDPGYPGFLFRRWYQGNEFSPSAVVKPGNYAWYSQSHDIQVVVNNGVYTAFVDGGQILQMTDTIYTQGGIGLRIWDSTVVCFEGIRVDPLP